MPEVVAKRKRKSFVALGSGEFEQNWMIWRAFFECSKVLSLMNAEEK